MKNAVVTSLAFNLFLFLYFSSKRDDLLKAIVIIKCSAFCSLIFSVVIDSDVILRVVFVKYCLQWM